ncbi:phage integrase SAM-like domain-containing protein [Maribellus sediminis]|uniref:phage integrase SAM-like domain-containing protein n=1 Tax=Maribellus sediminis TaxID=2696285 RepID=UPI0014321FCC|nr:phage integrase SAM-like domain-containing protein [Maribellus sediminis]
MSTFKATLLKGGNQGKKDGTFNIKIRVTHNRKSIYVATDLYVLWNDFDRDTGTAKSGANKDFINLRLTEKLLEYRKKDIELGDRREFMSVGDIKEHLLGKNITSKQIDFFVFIEEFIATVSNTGTKEQYFALLESLKSYTGPKLSVSKINLNFLLGYELFLKNRGVKNGVINYMRTFRALFNKCRDKYNEEEIGRILIPNYPFRKYNFPKRVAKSKEHVLTLEELKLLIGYVPENDGEKFARHMFLLMFYLVGIESKDLFYAGKPNMGRLLFDRFKTGRSFSIRVENEALAIIKQYEGHNYLLNVCERFKYNKSFYRYINNYLSGEEAHNIRGIFPKLGIQKKVTTKWARHTWATIARNDCRISKDDVAFALGHVDMSNRVTDMYIKFDYSIVDDCNRKVLDLIKFQERFSKTA